MMVALGVGKVRLQIGSLQRKLDCPPIMRCIPNCVARRFWRLTSRTLCEQGLKRSVLDLAEIDALPKLVVAHKATAAGPGVLVEDTSLDIDGENVGVNVKWIETKIDIFAGRSARWRVMLAVLDDKTRKVNVFSGKVRAHRELIATHANAVGETGVCAEHGAECAPPPVPGGQVDGTIVAPRGESLPGFEFDKVFQPNGSRCTLAEEKVDKNNARYRVSQSGVTAHSLQQAHSVRPISDLPM